MSDVVSGSLGWRNVVVLQKKHRTQNVNVRKHFEVECALLSKNESFYRRKCKKNKFALLWGEAQSCLPKVNLM